MEISCEKCQEVVCRYQKDGPGGLRRMYLDRIIEPTVSISEKSLKCSNGHLLGVEIIYAKENRRAFRIISDAVKKKIIKSEKQ